MGIERSHLNVQAYRGGQLEWHIVSSSKSSLVRWWVAITVFVVVIAALVAGGMVWNANHRYEVRPPSASEKPAEPALMPAGAEDTRVPDVSAAVAKTAKDPALGKLTAAVSDLETGEALWQQNAAAPRTPASATKIFTAAAATLAIDNDERLETYVVQKKPGELILVGEGDVTLSETPDSGFFTDAANIRELAKQVRPQLGDKPIERIVVDNSVREGSVFNSTWDRADISGGNVANLDSAMLDAGRIQPKQADSPRSEVPGGEVAEALATELGLGDVDVEVEERTAATPMTQEVAGNAKDALPEGLTWMGGVQSAPLHTRIRDMLIHSDNLLAEAIGREIAETKDQPRTFAGATKATLQILSEEGVNTKGAVLKDNSGMSTSNRLSAEQLNQALSHDGLEDVLDMLPVSGAEGTLLNRYADGSGSENSAGWVRAKTGTLSGVNALAGSVTTKQGRVLTFAFLSDGKNVSEARAALDRLANSLRNAQ